MPLFIFISGYFSKSIKSQRKSDILHVLVPYLIIELIHFAFTKTSGLGEGKLNPALPTYQNWYLLALFIWRLFVPYFNFFNRKAAITVVVLLALGIGFISEFNGFLALYRSIFFMPFFVLGYYCTDLKSIMNRFSKFKILFILGFLMSMAVIFVLSYKNETISAKLLYAYLPIFGYEHHLGFLFMRTFALISSFMICFSLLFLIPDKKTWFSKYGENTLYVFLFHMFIVWPVNLLFLPYQPIITESLCLASALLITWLLSQEWLIKCLKPLIFPDFLITLIRPVKKQ